MLSEGGAGRMLEPRVPHREPAATNAVWANQGRIRMCYTFTMVAREAVRFYRSALLDEEMFVHGSPERGGGVSQGLRRSLNLGVRWGDDGSNVERNMRRLADAASFSLSSLISTKHVHGTEVWNVGEPKRELREFDGMVSDQPGVVLGAFHADCLPLLFADPVARVCGAAHAGWRGTAGSIAKNVVAYMKRAGASASNIRAVIGPSIGPCCFEVGDEVVAAFLAQQGERPHMVVSGPRKNHIDLWSVTRAQLLEAGLNAANLDTEPPCTVCNPDRFFSYRRDGREGGMHMSFIGLR